MFRVTRSDTRFGLSIVLPVLAVFAITAGTLTYALREVASEVNRTELSATRTTVDAAVQATLRRMAGVHNDYAVWDDAARKLYGAVDQQFVEESIASSTADPVLFDTVYLVEDDGVSIFAYRHGEPVAETARQAFGPVIDRLIGELPDDRHAYDVRTALVNGAWGPAVVAVGPVVPFSRNFTLPDGPARFLVLAKAFDNETVAHIAEDYLIGGLALAAADTASAAESETSTVLTDPDGKALAALTWTASQPGSQALARLSPSVTGMLVLLAATMAILTIVALRGFARVRLGEAQARHAATHDTLSGLPNRRALHDRLKRAVDDLHRGGDDVAMLYLDLDGFKEVNETYGHDIGDVLLRKVAKGFEALAGGHLLVRLGGDEFAIVVDAPRAADEAAILADKLVRFFAKPFDIGGRIISMSTSVGIALIDRTDISVDEALRRADVAMQQAKQQGRNRVCVFDNSLDALRLKRMTIAAELRRALQDEALTMFYQPVYDAQTGRVGSVEALIRWPRDDGPPISPGEFIPIAEETGLIDALGAWTLRRACEDARAWPGVKVSVNASPAQFHNPDFADTVARVLRDLDFPASRLEIEVTETYFMTHPEQARRAIDAVRALGIAVALDDFGIGYSSIGYLRRFAFDKLKLDRSLIADIDRDPHAQRLVQATVALAEALDMTVTAEGVETREEATLLRIAGCDAFQGFYFGRPVPASEITALIGADAKLRAPLRLA